MVVKLKFLVAFLASAMMINFSCGQTVERSEVSELPAEAPAEADDAPALQVICGAERLDSYLPLLKEKRVALLVNHTSLVGKTHLADTLHRLGIRIEKIFAPEHGFRGLADAGEHVTNSKDDRTGIPVVSLYGDKKKPSKEDLAGLDLVIFDVQDVGARFYTYIYTMTYLMEACAENRLPLMVLDRPNPNGHYVDGPVLQKGYTSFVGLHEIPVVHGMTVGEYAQLLNGEGWLSDSAQCKLTVISCENYDHTVRYHLPEKPSPNLPNMRAIYLYPSICFFEGTNVSLGRGTRKQFQILGAPDFPKGNFTFVPMPMDGAKTPPLQGKTCRGFDLSDLSIDDLGKRNQLDLSYLLDFYQHFPDKDAFFLKNLFFDKLAGSAELRKQLIAGMQEEQIRKSWAGGLQKFKTLRKKYLLYKDFE